MKSINLSKVIKQSDSAIRRRYQTTPREEIGTRETFMREEGSKLGHNLWRERHANFKSVLES